MSYNPGPPFSIGSGYGIRTDPFTGNQAFHAGIDFRAPVGTPIPAADGGTVVYSGFNAGLGNTVIIQNDRGDYSLYAHMTGADMPARDSRVEAGDTVGLLGGTGSRADGPHLHYSEITPEAGAGIARADGGPLGINLNGATTADPTPIPLPPSRPFEAGTQPVPYLEESQRAAEIMNGGSAAPNSANDGPATFDDRFNAVYGNLGNGQLPTPDGYSVPPASPFPDPPSSFADRFEPAEQLQPPSWPSNVSPEYPYVNPNSGSQGQPTDPGLFTPDSPMTTYPWSPVSGEAPQPDSPGPADNLSPADADRGAELRDSIRANDVLDGLSPNER